MAARMKRPETDEEINDIVACSTRRDTHSTLLTICQVLEYLSKKGYVRTEAMLRKESEPQANGQPLVSGSTDIGGAKYTKSFELLRKYTEDNLDLYRPELKKLHGSGARLLHKRR
jgi:hypothetical protein